MTGFLATLAARAVGTGSPLQPRRAQRFERPGPGPSRGLPETDLAPPRERADAPSPAAAEDAVDSPAPAPTSRARHRGATAAPPGPVLDAARADAGTGRRAPDPAIPSGGPSEVEVDAARAAARAAAERAAAEVSLRPASRSAPGVAARRDAAPRPADRVPGTAAAQASPGARPGPGPDVRPGRPEGAGDPITDGPTAAYRELAVDTSATHAVEPGRPAKDAEAAAAVPRGRATDGAGSPASLRPVPTPRPPAGRALDLAALLREEVYAALVERGAAPRGERPVVEPAGRRRPPRPGTAAVRAEGVRAPEQESGPTGAGDVHVHIDRVTVTRAPAPQPRPSAPTQPRAVVDHAAYLARRRERG